jgi:hypothetical protein
LHDQVLLLPPEALLFTLPHGVAAAWQAWMYSAALGVRCWYVGYTRIAVRRVAITLLLRISKLRLMIKVTPVTKQSS